MLMQSHHWWSEMKKVCGKLVVGEWDKAKRNSEKYFLSNKTGLYDEWWFEKLTSENEGRKNPLVKCKGGSSFLLVLRPTSNPYHEIHIRAKIEQTNGSEREQFYSNFVTQMQFHFSFWKVCIVPVLSFPSQRTEAFCSLFYFCHFINWTGWTQLLHNIPFHSSPHHRPTPRGREKLKGNIKSCHNVSFY